MNAGGASAPPAFYFHGGVRHIKDTDWTQELFKFFNIRPGAADILTG